MIALRRPRGSVRERGFTLVEVMIALVILGIAMAALAQLLLTWSKATVHAAIKQRRAEVESDLRRLYVLEVSHMLEGGGTTVPAAGPWPPSIPLGGPIAWTSPNPGFDALGWAPTRSPTWLQYRVDSWSTGFMVSAVGDLDRDGSAEQYRIRGDNGMYEGPLPWPDPAPPAP